MANHLRSLSPLLIPPIPIHHFQRRQLFILDSIKTHHIHTNKFAQPLRPVAAPKGSHAARSAEQVVYLLGSELVICEVLFAIRVESEVRRGDGEFPGSSFGADAAVAFPRRDVREVEMAGKGYKAAMAAACVSFQGHGFVESGR